MSLVSDERVEELLEKEERLEAEIERLRLKLGQAEKIAKLVPESAAEIGRLRAARSDLIEECARVAMDAYAKELSISDAITAIRALKP